MRVSMIVAVAENGVIGKDNDLPWRLSSDLKYFKQVTGGKPVLMGRKTWESLPRRPLPNRPNIVITRDASYVADGAHVVASVEEAIAKARALLSTGDGEEAVIMGGAQIYKAGYAFADRLYYTQVHANVEGDTYFDDVDLSEWREVSRDRQAAGEKDSSDYSLIVYDRIR